MGFLVVIPVADHTTSSYKNPCDIHLKSVPLTGLNLERTSAHCQEGFIPVKDAPWAHASIGSQRRDAGFKQRRNASVEQSITTRLRVAIQISCQNHRFKHLNFQYIYPISYKIAKKADPPKSLPYKNQVN